MRILKSIIIFLLVFATTVSCKKVKITSVTTEATADIKASKATLKATIKNTTNANIAEKGFCYLINNPAPFYDDNTSFATYAFEDTKYEAKIKNLKANTKYYVRAFIKLSNGTVIYGDAQEFSTNSDYGVGDAGPAGGIIFDVDAYGKSGKYSEIFIIPSTNLPWGCNGIEVGNLSVQSGDAISNTNKINQQCGGGSAANYCLNYSINGYADWYLPTVGELSDIYYSNKYGNFSFPADSYWTSSEYDESNAYSVDFSSGTWVHLSKSSNIKVAAIRYFN
jgi:hypothetical protein